VDRRGHPQGSEGRVTVPMTRCGSGNRPVRPRRAPKGRQFGLYLYRSRNSKMEIPGHRLTSTLWTPGEASRIGHRQYPVPPVPAPQFRRRDKTTDPIGVLRVFAILQQLRSGQGYAPWLSAITSRQYVTNVTDRTCSFVFTFAAPLRVEDRRECAERKIASHRRGEAGWV
jgi:hypothetical protein